MGLEDVKTDILNDAEKEADSIIEEAKERAESIVEDAETEAEKIKEASKQEIEKEKESIRKEALSNARMEARQEKLAAKQDRLEEVFQSFREHLEELDDDELEAFVEESKSMTEFEIGETIGSSRFEEFVDEVDDNIDGIILVSADGEKRQNFTFDKITEQYRSEYRKAVADILFG